MKLPSNRTINLNKRKANHPFDLETVTILVIEDDPNLQFLLEKGLSQSNRQILVASSNANLCSTLENQKIDLVLLDVALHKRDALLLCQEIRRAYAMPIIVLSAITEPALQTQALQLGANLYLTKPVRLAVLQESVRQLLAEYHSRCAMQSQ